MELLGRYFRPAKESFFLFGARGTGKSTWARATYPKAVAIDLLTPSHQRTYSARPEKLAEMVHGTDKTRTFIIDEIQKVPVLLDVVHQLIEEKRGYQFILTGSSARKLKRGGVDLLAGRAALRAMHPFMAGELGKHFKFETALRQGLLPLVWGAKDPDDVLRAYAGLYVREEVQAEGLVRSVGNFHRFIEAISFSQAGVLNVSNIARECEVERKSVEGFVSILEDLLLAFRLSVFTKRAKRELSHHPKFYFTDAGVFRAVRPKGPLDRPGEIDGQALEGLVAQHLRAWCEYRGKDDALHFWRTRGGLEVDFVVYGEAGLWAIEVKNAARVRPEELRALAEFGKEYPAAKRLFLYRGKERLLRDGILCLPVSEFLAELHPSRALA